MSLMAAGTININKLIEYIMASGIGRRNQIKVLSTIWRAERNGWEPPTEIRDKLQQLVREQEKASHE